MSKHSLGPWVRYADVPSADPNWHIITTENRMRVIANVHIEPGNETDLANADVLTAAGDLLTALEGLLDAAEAEGCQKWWPHRMERARAAINKAKGLAQ